MYAGQTMLARPLRASDDHSLPNGGMGSQRRLDFTQFNTKAPDLDLMIEPAEEFEVAVRPIARQVAGFIKAGAWFAAEGIGDELLGGEFGAVQISASEARAANV